MKVPETVEAYVQMWRDAGLDDSAIKKIQPLVGLRHYIQIKPAPDAKVWSRWGGVAWLEQAEITDEDRFLCQIALDELPDGPARQQLPDAGYLYFFVHKRGRDKGRILHTPQADGADDPATYRSPAAEGQRFEHGTPIEFVHHTVFVFPEYESDAFDELDLPAEAGNAYMDWEESYLGDADSRFYEGCRLLGGWTDGMERLKKTLSAQECDALVPLLSLDPKENRQVANSALGNIPILSQPLYFLVSAASLTKKKVEPPVCRYGVVR